MLPLCGSGFFRKGQHADFCEIAGGIRYLDTPVSSDLRLGPGWVSAFRRVRPAIHKATSRLQWRRPRWLKAGIDAGSPCEVAELPWSTSTTLPSLSRKVLGTTTLRAINQQLPRRAHQASILQIVCAGRLAITPGRWCIVLAVPSWLVYVKHARGSSARCACLCDKSV